MRACSVAGCHRPSRSNSAELCDTHYYQIRRNGYLGPKQRPRVIEHSAGYLKLAAPGHRLTTPCDQYRVYEHRAEFHREFGDGPFRCVGCGVEIDWDSACVCRETGDKADNRIANLEIRCRSCASKKAYDASRKTLEDIHYRWVEWRGDRKTATEWAHELGMRPKTFLRRLNGGWSIERIVTTKVNAARSDARPYRRKLSDAQAAEIVEMASHFPYNEIADAYGVGASTIGRIVRGERIKTAQQPKPSSVMNENESRGKAGTETG